MVSSFQSAAQNTAAGYNGVVHNVSRKVCAHFMAKAVVLTRMLSPSRFSSAASDLIVRQVERRSVIGKHAQLEELKQRVDSGLDIVGNGCLLNVVAASQRTKMLCTTY